MAKHPTGSKRNRKQKVKARYAKAREEAQLSGVIETTPEGAVRDERVNPAVQSEQALPALDRRAVREEGVNGWSVPEEVKRKVVERLAEPFFETERVVLDREGKRVVLPPDRNLLKENAKVLVLADQRQYERDQPEMAGKAKGVAGQTNIQVNNVIDYYGLFKQLIEERGSENGWERERQGQGEQEGEQGQPELGEGVEESEPVESDISSGEDSLAGGEVL